MRRDLLPIREAPYHAASLKKIKEEIAGKAGVAESGVAECLGQKCLALDGGAATVKDFLLRDGTIDVDGATPARRGFF